MSVPSTPPKKQVVAAQLAQRGVSFTAVFVTVTFITFGCLLAFVVTGILVPEPTEYQHAVFESLKWGWQGGFGALLTLLGTIYAR